MTGPLQKVRRSNDRNTQRMYKQALRIFTSAAFKDPSMQGACLKHKSKGVTFAASETVELGSTQGITSDQVD